LSPNVTLYSPVVTQVSSPAASPPKKGKPPLLLPPDWHGKFPDEWLFSYLHPDKMNPFSLHCSLQRVSGRMLVNGLEANNMQFNSQVGVLRGRGGGRD
jgi:hypothetical protein